MTRETAPNSKTDTLGEMSGYTPYRHNLSYLTSAEKGVERQVRLPVDQVRRGLPHDTVREEGRHLHAEGRAHRGGAVPPRTLRPGVSVLLLLVLLLFVVDVIVATAVVLMGADLTFMWKSTPIIISSFVISSIVFH